MLYHHQQKCFTHIGLCSSITSERRVISGYVSGNSERYVCFFLLYREVIVDVVVIIASEKHAANKDVCTLEAILKCGQLCCFCVFVVKILAIIQSHIYCVLLCFSGSTNAQDRVQWITGPSGAQFDSITWNCRCDKVRLSLRKSAPNSEVVSRYVFVF